MSDLAAKVQKIKPAEKFQFGEWLPDVSELDNPGVLEASNVLWSGGSYVPYRPFIPSGFQVPGGLPLAAIRGTATANMLFVASTNGVNNFISGSSGSSFNFSNLTGSPLVPSTIASFAQYGSTVIYADGLNPTQFNGMNLANTFAKLTGPYGDAPIGQVVGVIGQFVILGDMRSLGQGTSLQWSGINAPFNWPTPGSAPAIAQQAGSQFLDYTLGVIYGISQGDQWGMIIQENGLTRVQYVGGDVVFQFDNLYRGPTATNPHSWIKVGGRVYSCAGDGFLMTDGVSVRRIGDAKVDRWFLNTWGGSSFNIATGVDPQLKVIYWTFAKTGTGNVPNAWIAYNYVEDRWTHGTDGIACFVSLGENLEVLSGFGMQAFSSADAPQGGGYGGTLSGTPGSAVIVTPEIELNPGGRALMQGFRPQITGLPSGAATVRIGSRARLGDQVIYTPQLQVNGQTNFADVLIDASYHRAEVTLNGAFNQAMGGEFKAEPSGQW